MIEIPRGLTAATVEREGDAGGAWLDGLAEQVSAACERWSCTVNGPPTHGQVALVVPVRHPRGPAALKISFPHPGNRGESVALRAFAGNGAAELFEVDDTGFELVIERCLPRSLAAHATAHPDTLAEEFIEIAGCLARRLAVAAPAGMTRLADTIPAWAEEVDRQRATFAGALPAPAVQRALETLELLAADRTPTMLHGDLHVGNILASDRAPWLAIDPKGWSGPLEFDAFTTIIGRREELDPARYAPMRQRIRRFAAAASADEELAMACCHARAVSAYYHRLPAGEATFDGLLLRTMILGEAD